MRRGIYKDLLKWKNSVKRKPLMLYGARQVGKTYILRQFGRNEFENMVYINCYKNQAVATLFEEDKDIDRILLGLSALSGEEINKGTTLIFLDEVQEIPDVIASLKYFCEDAPEIAIAVAGSLLGVVNMEGRSFPTGKVNILYMYPMNFVEFLEAAGEEKLVELLDQKGNEDVVNALLDKYVDRLRQYYFVGGMPEAVLEFVESYNLERVREIQKEILKAYSADIAKHAGRETQKARAVFEAIPAQLARENKKFIFGVLKKGARAAEYESAIQWLVDAGLVYKVNRLSKVELPIKFYIEKDIFKLFLLDIGLLGAMVDISASTILIGRNIFSEYKGAFTENYVLNQMKCVNNLQIGYFSKDNSTIEIDFIVQAADHLLPIEVKAEENVKSKSLRQFIEVDNADKDFKGYRFSMRGFADQKWMENIPLCAVYSYLNTGV
ncbi:MAG: ATP-binding protein [Muribaculaceae bacterium]|nr:ATP-binding protein [Muribaculaceae bacterium]